eukprot:4594851-Prymnesium_polylepis.1
MAPDTGPKRCLSTPSASAADVSRPASTATRMHHDHRDRASWRERPGAGEQGQHEAGRGARAMRDRAAGYRSGTVCCTSVAASRTNTAAAR